MISVHETEHLSLQQIEKFLAAVLRDCWIVGSGLLVVGLGGSSRQIGLQGKTGNQRAAGKTPPCHSFGIGLPGLGGDGCYRINPDPVISHYRAGVPAIPVKDDETRLLLRHMAIDAVVRNWMRHFGMALGLMTAQAMLGECSRILLRHVNIMAGQASHRRGPEAAAFPEHFDLAAVDINGRIWIGPWQLKVFVQGLARYIGKRRQ
jgi:hypothetical protein